MQISNKIDFVREYYWNVGGAKNMQKGNVRKDIGLTFGSWNDRGGGEWEGSMSFRRKQFGRLTFGRYRRVDQ